MPFLKFEIVWWLASSFRLAPDTKNEGVRWVGQNYKIVKKIWKRSETKCKNSGSCTNLVRLQVITYHMKEFSGFHRMSVGLPQVIPSVLRQVGVKIPSGRVMCFAQAPQWEARLHFNSKPINECYSKSRPIIIKIDCRGSPGWLNFRLKSFIPVAGI
jgi:hypothetical protein